MSARYCILIIVLMTALTLCCKGDNCGDARCGDAFGDYVDPVVSAIGGAIDDQIGSLYASNRKSRYAGLIDFEGKFFFISDAWAASCARPSTALCISETEFATYTSCTIDPTSFLYNGMVTLSYAGTPNCGFVAVGDTVTRTLNVSRTVPGNGVVYTSSENNTDHRGIVVGGGTKLTIAGANSYSLDIAGVNKVLYKNSIKWYDLLLRTTAPLFITGGLNRDGRVINSGSLEVITNDSVLSFVPANVQYTSACCYPISGSLRFVSTGALRESGSISFPACGTATVARDGDATPYNVTLVSCE